MIRSTTLALFFSVFLFSAAFAQPGLDWFNKGQDTEDDLLKVDYYTKAIDAGYPDTDIYYFRGWAHYDLRKYAKALRDFQAANAGKGSIKKGYICVGEAWAAYALGETSKARAAAAKARELLPAYAQAFNISAWIESDAGDYAKAATFFDDYIRLEPKDDYGYASRAYLWLMQRMYDKALADADKALSIDPHNTWAQQRKALALLKLDRMDEGIQLLEGSVTFKKDDPLSLSNIGSVFYSAGDYKGAIDFHTKGILLYEKKIKEDPKYIKEFREDIYNIYMNRGASHFALKEYQTALQDYSKATTIKPEDHRAWLEIGELQTFQKNWLEATHAYEKGFAINPTYPDGWVNLGFCYDHLGDSKKAISAYTRGIAANPDVGLLYNNRGYAYLELKQFDLSIVDLRKAIEVEPTEVMSHVSLGEYYYYSSKDYASAITKLTECIKMPDGDMTAYRTAYYTRGLCYLEQAQYDQAEKDFAEAVDLDYKFAEGYEKLGIAHYNQKEYCESYTALKRAVDLDSHNTPRKAPEAPKFLAKLTTNPCNK